MHLKFFQVALAAALTVFGVAGSAFGDPRIDLVPLGLSFAKGLDDDVSMAYSQHVSIRVQNNGNAPWGSSSSSMRVAIAGRIVTASIYGPHPDGYWVLGGRINPGQFGSVSLRLPLRTLVHCQSTPLTIDLGHTQQFGPAVFSNDSKTLIAVNLQAFRPFCPVIVRPQPEQ